jgi:hypothetical protein
MTNPKKVVDSLVPEAGIYPPASAYHFIALEAIGCKLIDVVSGKWDERKFEWNDFALAHVCFNTKADVLYATLQREGREWLSKKAIEWSVKTSPSDYSKVVTDLEAHIMNSLKTIPAFDAADGVQKKTSADGP